MAKFIKRDTNIFSKVFMEKEDLSNYNEATDNYLVIANNTLGLIVLDRKIVSIKKPGTYKLNGMNFDSIYISKDLYDYNLAGDVDKPIEITFSNGEFILLKFNYFLTINWKSENVNESILYLTDFNDVNETDIKKFIEKTVRANLNKALSDFNPEELKDYNGNYCNGFVLDSYISNIIEEALKSIGIVGHISVDMITINNPSFYDEIDEKEDEEAKEKAQTRKEENAKATSNFFDNVFKDAFEANSSKDNDKSLDENLTDSFVNNLFGSFFGKK